MSFNAAATRLAVSSSNRTIHIFDVSTGGAGGGSIGIERGRASRRSSNSPRQESGHVVRARQGQEGGAETGVGGEKNSSRRRGTGDVRGSDAGTGTSGGGGGGGGGLASGLRSVVGMLPNRMTKTVQDYVDSNRSFASVRLGGSAGRSICALVPAGDGGLWAGRGGAGAGAGAGEGGSESGDNTEEAEILLVVTNEGILYSYAVDTVRGGECRLEQASSLLMDPGASQEIGSELYVPERHAPPVLAGQS